MKKTMMLIMVVVITICLAGCIQKEDEDAVEEKQIESSATENVEITNVTKKFESAIDTVDDATDSKNEIILEGTAKDVNIENIEKNEKIEEATPDRENEETQETEVEIELIENEGIFENETPILK